MRALNWLPQLIIASLALCSSAGAQDQVRWQPNLEAAQRLASQTDRLIVIHFWAPWCKPCMQMEREVFGRPETGRALEVNFVAVKLNVDESPATARMYGVSSLPTDVIITPGGRLVAATQSPPSASQYISQLNQLADGHKRLARASLVGKGGPASPTAGALGRSTPTAFAGNTPIGASPPQTATPQSVYSDQHYAEYIKEHAAQSPPGGAPAANAVNPRTPNPGATVAAVMAAGPVTNAVASQPVAPAVQMPLQTPVQPAVPAATGNQPPASGGPMLPDQSAGNGAAPQAPPGGLSKLPTMQLPPGSPPLALDGFCPVTLSEKKAWTKGDTRWGAIHRGQTYLFNGAEEQQRFLSKPDAYSPVISGNDPVLALDNRQSVAGRREHGLFFENRIYLFSTEASLDRFKQNPNRYAAEVIQAMR